METSTSTSTVGRVAPMRNVFLLRTLIERVSNRDHNLPGMACFFGPSGYGKTMATTWNANQVRAYWVEMRESWTRKSLLGAILTNMGIEPKRTIPEMSRQISEELSRSGRPLLIDEADYLLKARMVELVREIYEDSQSPIILIGEERLPQNLAAIERVHNRMLDWVAAEPADLHEVGLLAELKCSGIVIAEDVKQLILAKSGARARRIDVNLSKLREYAVVRGITEITMKEAAGIAFFTGDAPAPRGGRA